MLRSSPSPRSSARGFTLIEAMVSFFVVTIGMIGLFSGYTTAVRANDYSKKVSQATAIAQAVAHELANARWDAPELENVVVANDNDPDDRDKAFLDQVPNPKADHQLVINAIASPTPANSAQDVLALKAFKGNELLDYGTDGIPDFEVFWNVSNCTLGSTTTPWTIDCNNKTQAQAVLKQIGVIVRWPVAGGDSYQRVATQLLRGTTGNMGL